MRRRAAGSRPFPDRGEAGDEQDRDQVLDDEHAEHQVPEALHALLGEGPHHDGR
ncbi:MAG: hypothetical protein U1E65_05465 [Myxococcota bacterium]